MAAVRGQSREHDSRERLAELQNIGGKNGVSLIVPRTQLHCHCRPRRRDAVPQSHTARSHLGCGGSNIASRTTLILPFRPCERVSGECVPDGKDDFLRDPGAGPHGTKVWYETHLGPVKEGDEIVAVALFSTDITVARKPRQPCALHAIRWNSK